MTVSSTSSRLPLIIEPLQFEGFLGQENILLVDVSQDQAYATYHIPGAVHVAPSELVSGLQPAVGKLPSVERLSALLTKIGLGNEQHVVVYDHEGGGWAGRFIWTLDVIGHGNYSYLNGGIHAWKNEGHPLEHGIENATVATSAEYQVQIHPQAVAEKEDILQQLCSPDPGSPDSSSPQWVIWDARSAEEYAGTKCFAARAGHIPGAVNLAWLDLMDRQRNLRLLPLEDLKQKLNALGISADKQIVSHCQTHHRSGLSYLVCKALGFPHIKAYAGSWSEWGNDPDTPIEQGAQKE